MVDAGKSHNMNIPQLLHNAWCLITGKCPVDLNQQHVCDIDGEKDDMLVWLKDQEEASHAAIAKRRVQHDEKINRLERLLLQSHLDKLQHGKAQR